jgi:hypothetical protein
MTFRIAKRIATPAVVLALDVHDDLRPRGLGPRRVRIGILDDDVSRLGFSDADLVWLLHQAA